MFTNHLKVILRNLRREKMYAAINISGLAIAIACVLILGLYVRSELTYDRYNVQYKQIFRVVNEWNENGILDTLSTTSTALGPMLAEDYPEVRAYVRIAPYTYEGGLFYHGDDAFYWNDIYLTDKNIFNIFTHEIIYGDSETALDDPTSIAVSESFARKYFGDANPIGETIRSENSTYKITLVFSDLPGNCHLRYDVLISFEKSELPETLLSEDLLQKTNSYTYLLMPENYVTRAFKTISDSFFKNHMANMGKRGNVAWRCWLQPLTEIHFQTEVFDDLPTGNRFYVYGLAFVALIIMLAASINYMNMATARAVKRSKEVGMRKILGEGRTTLIFRFLGESVCFSLIALFFGLVVVEIILNLTPLNEVMNKSLRLDLSREPYLPGWMLLFGILLGLLSGIYPAFYQSAGKPLSTLTGGIRTGKAGIRFRHLLVLVQFIITIGVISCALLMALQMRYVSHKPLGFKKENRLIITLRGEDLLGKMPTIRKELLQNSEILGISIATDLRPLGLNGVGGSNPGWPLQIENNSGVLEEVPLKLMFIGDDFIDVMGIQILAGRDFSKELRTDADMNWIVNESLVKKMGWTKAIGKRINDMDIPGRVIGVVKDFHSASLHSPIVAYAIIHPRTMDIKDIPAEFRTNEQRLLILNIDGNDIPRTLRFLEEKFAEFDPAHPFQFDFLDDLLNDFYLSEQRLLKLTGISAGVCIFISCLGLLGLTSLTTEQRTKEIGIRKVLGASTRQIILLLSQNILLLVLISAVIASLIAYYFIDNWLAGFAYHTGINPLVFLLSTAVAAAVAFMTVALQSFKTARANPVNALRYE